MNQHELLKIGGDLNISGSVLEIAWELRSRYGCAVAATAGGGTALLVDGHIATFEVPLVQPINTTGAGDCVTAGILAGVCRGLGLHESFSLGLAVGTASCLTDRGAAFTLADVQRFATQVKRTELKASLLDF